MPQSVHRAYTIEHIFNVYTIVNAYIYYTQVVIKYAKYIPISHLIIHLNCMYMCLTIWYSAAKIVLNTHSVRISLTI